MYHTVENTADLPQGYRPTYVIDLRTNGKLTLGLSAIGLVLAVGLIGLMHLAMPFTLSLEGEVPVWVRLLMPLLVLLLISVYFKVHELIHGALMRHFSGQKVKYQFRIFTASAGLPGFYFNGRSYCVIRVTPVVVLGLFLAVVLLFLDGAWFWTFYLVEVFNLLSAVTDFYNVYKARCMPRDVLVQDTGAAVKYYNSAQL
jgi:hypothetical protein